MKATTGIRRLHSGACPARSSKRARCRCGAGYEAAVWDSASRRKIRKTFPTLAAARSWRSDAEHGVRRGTLRASEPVTVNDAADELVAGMESGAARTRSGDPYKPSTIRSYRESLELHVRDELGAMRLGDVQRRHVQRLADRLVAERHSPSTVRNALLPLRVLFRRALRDNLVAFNPCDGVELPANRSARPEIVSDEVAAALVAALADRRERALWATAFYAGLRRGELMALRWRDLDLANGAIHVERSYDPKERLFVAPKSQAGRRRVPIAGALRDVLLDLRAELAEVASEALAFGETAEQPFDDEALLERARGAWAAAAVGAFLRGEPLDPPLEPVGLHVARHTCASVMIAAGVNVKALSEFLGHASITITLDRYGHLLPGSLAEAATLLDAFLGRNGELSGERDEKSLQTGDSGRSCKPLAAERSPVGSNPTPAARLQSAAPPRRVTAHGEPR
jgi:integrase